MTHNILRPLHCRRCKERSVRLGTPKVWEGSGKRCWQIQAICRVCLLRVTLYYTDYELDHLEQRDEMGELLEGVWREDISEWVEQMVAALQSGLIQPEDFGRP